mgnify:CR=1 FL=1|tara:strand:- start:2166 stop:3251 length:1086 start_codon:yes stop_codon:yes gene_type:complete
MINALWGVLMKSIFFSFLLSFFIHIHVFYAQSSIKNDSIPEISILFKNKAILPLKIGYSNRDLKKNTNDSTFIDVQLSYEDEPDSWKTLDVKLRARGNFRKAKCYFPPVHMRIKKSVGKGTIFEGNKRLKLVLPCSMGKVSNDNIVKEFLAYKLYEVISPYHFNTRMVTIDFSEVKGKKKKEHKIKGFLIEDDKIVANRFNGKLLRRFVHPLEQDDITSVQHAFFQYMISNSDFSVAYLHNQKLIYVDNKIIPVPYDFDMSGLVNASYAVVSQIQEEHLNITHVTQRLYRGFKRDNAIFNQVRKEFIDNKPKLLAIVDSFASSFENPREYYKAKDFIQDFYEVIEDQSKYDRNIIAACRMK